MLEVMKEVSLSIEKDLNVFATSLINLLEVPVPSLEVGPQLEAFFERTYYGNLIDDINSVTGGVSINLCIEVCQKAINYYEVIGNSPDKVSFLKSLIRAFERYLSIS